MCVRACVCARACSCACARKAGANREKSSNGSLPGAAAAGGGASGTRAPSLQPSQATPAHLLPAGDAAGARVHHLHVLALADDLVHRLQSGRQCTTGMVVVMMLQAGRQAGTYLPTSLGHVAVARYDSIGYNQVPGTIRCNQVPGRVIIMRPIIMAQLGMHGPTCLPRPPPSAWEGHNGPGGEGGGE